MKVSITIVGPVLLALFLPGCADDPASPRYLEDYGVQPSLVVAQGAPYVGGNTVALELAAPGADSCAVWNLVDDVAGDRTVVLLADGAAAVAGWQLAPGEGPRIAQAVFWGRGGIASHVAGDTVVVDATPPVAAGVVFPGAGDGPVNTLVKLRWEPFQDAWCGPEDLRYRVQATAGGRQWTTAFAAGTDAIIAGLPLGAEVSWQVIARDPAGNETVAGFPPFATWQVVLPEMADIPGGSFVMGSPPDEPGRRDTEVQHEVELTRGFAIATTQLVYGTIVPLLQWGYDHGLVTVDPVAVRDAVGTGGEIIWRLEFPFIQVVFDGAVFSLAEGDRSEPISRGLSWYGAAALADWLNLASGFDVVHDRASGWRAFGDVYAVQGYRLPTEAEWEFACRAGTQTAFWNGDLEYACCEDDPWCCCESATLDAVGWYCGNYRTYNGLPALKPANPWGLYDVHGGYRDWCYDTLDGVYPAVPVVDPVHFGSPSGHITRGANNYVGAVLAQGCRSATRGGGASYTSGHSGVRLVLSGFQPSR
ncbi:MAG: SUMF1/EgtB/PvdO family nonheme iron enzyme [Krumholzibacteria bacterium]|nr:SUMF1/EgtB/PvdO family nonheme iron enzyme [Candidatus Krumholzibacteria bacterium]